MMSFTESLSTCFKKTFVYQGRASRSEYWWFQLLFSICYLILIGGDEAVIFRDHPAYDVLIWMAIGVIVICILPGLAVTIRRLHDINKSGGLILISLIPFIGSLLLLLMLILEGTKGKNRFGKNPLKKR
tara:strand:- start:36 stop:422 length:387 start_codon:yes stop_codon:yes gene_type:complete